MILSFELFYLLNFKLVMKVELFIAYRNSNVLSDYSVCKFDCGNGLNVTRMFKMEAKHHVPMDE